MEPARSQISTSPDSALHHGVTVLDYLNHTVVILGDDGLVAHVNRAGERLFARSRKDLVGRHAADALPELFGPAFDRRREAAGAANAAIQFEQFLPSLDVWTDVHACVSPFGLLVSVRDVSARKARERILRGQKRVLEMVARFAPLPEILAAITSMIEQQSSGGDLCSILLLSKDGLHLHGGHGGALPPAYCAAIDGAAIGPAAGSCGTAAFTRQRVISADIQTDPRWADFRSLAATYGLRACWSQPILSRDGRRVLGTVANYSRLPGDPSPQSLLLLETAARLAQIALEQVDTEQHLRRQALAFDNLYDGIILTDRDGRITDLNRAAEVMFGYARQEILGNSVALLRGADPDAAARATREIIDVLAHDGCWRGEIDFVRKDGTDGVCETIVVPLNDDAGKLVATVGVNHDITERKRSESHLATEIAVTRILATARDLDDAVPRLLEAIGTTCGWETGAFWTVSDAGESLLRCRQCWSEPSGDLGPFERISRESALPRGVGLPGRVWATARPAWVTNVTEDGNFPRRAAAVAAGLRGALAFPVILDGRVIAVVEFFARTPRWRDGPLDAMFTVIGGQIGQFMHRVRAEQQLKAARDAAEGANKAKDRFLAMLSHELRNPLSPALLIASSMAADDRLPHAFQDDVRTIQTSIQLQARLIDDLLDLSRIENARLVLRTEFVDLHDVLRDCLLICDPDARVRDLAITADLCASGHVVRGDPARLKQVVCNLITNALKFTPPGSGSVTIRSADAAPGRVRVSITDTGVGAEPDVLRKIFDPFEQAGRARQSQGLGLGLTICKGIVEAHGGTISAFSAGPGLGMTITVELPTISEPVLASAASPHGAPARAPTSLRILLVDDHAETLRAMARLLQRMEHHVITADCVKSALDAAEQNDFDLLISDVGLPDGTGNELIQEILKRKPVRGIALTGFGMESDIQQTREAGYFAHLTKPVDLDKLEKAIREGAAWAAPP